jgi:hypothetical protein
MRTARLLSVLVVSFCLLPSPFASAQTDGDVERIRAALERPSLKLTFDYPTPTFRVRIEERRPLQDLFDVPAWMPEQPGWQPPAGVSLSSIVGYVVHEIAAAKRGHDLRLAREEVVREIAAYCAAQADSGSGIAICSSAATRIW